MRRVNEDRWVDQRWSVIHYEGRVVVNDWSTRDEVIHGILLAYHNKWRAVIDDVRWALRDPRFRGSLAHGPIVALNLTELDVESPVPDESI